MHSGRPAAQSAAPSAGLCCDRRQAGGMRKPLAIFALLVLLPLAVLAALRFFHNPTNGAADEPIAGLASIAWPRSSNRTPQPAQPAAGMTAVASVDSMIVGLEGRLAREPGDTKGWALLAQSYAFLGDIPKAESALSRAVELGFDAADLRRRIDLASKGPTVSDRGNLVAGPVVINGVVKLASATPLELAPESRLFVTAKAIDGSTVPVAVLGQRVTEFPYQFALSDKDAMMPGVKLADFEQVALTARLSQLGTAERSDSDLESAIKIVRLGEPGWVDLVIENR